MYCSCVLGDILVFLTRDVATVRGNSACPSPCSFHTDVGMTMLDTHARIGVDQGYLVVCPTLPFVPRRRRALTCD